MDGTRGKKASVPAMSLKAGNINCLVGTTLGTSSLGLSALRDLTWWSLESRRVGGLCVCVCRWVGVLRVDPNIPSNLNQLGIKTGQTHTATVFFEVR